MSKNISYLTSIDLVTNEKLLLWNVWMGGGSVNYSHPMSYKAYPLYSELVTGEESLDRMIEDLKGQLYE